MKTTVNARKQGWVDGIHYLLIRRHLDGAPDELLDKYISYTMASMAIDELDEVAKALSIIVGPTGTLEY